MGGSPRGSAYSAHFARVWCRLTSLGISVAAESVAAKGAILSAFAETQCAGGLIWLKVDSCCTMEFDDGSACKTFKTFKTFEMHSADAVSSESFPAAWFRELAKWRNDMVTRNWGDDSAVDQTVGSCASQAVW